MEKSKLGISIGIVAALAYFMGIFSGYTVLVLLVGYVLLKEENAWLKKQSVQALLLLVAFSLLSVAVNLIPNLLGLLYDALDIVGVHLYLSVIENLFGLVASALSLVRTVVFVLLGIAALLGKDIKIPGVDGLLSKHIG